MLSNSGLYLRYFEYYIVRFWFFLKFCGKMYLSFCFSRQSTQLISTISVPLSVYGGSNVSLRAFATLFGSAYTCTTQVLVWDLSDGFNAVSFSNLLLFLWACSAHVQLGGKPRICAVLKNRRFPFYSSLLSGISPIFSSSKGPFPPVPLAIITCFSQF